MGTGFFTSLNPAEAGGRFGWMIEQLEVWSDAPKWFTDTVNKLNELIEASNRQDRALVQIMALTGMITSTEERHGKMSDEDAEHWVNTLAKLTNG